MPPEFVPVFLFLAEEATVVFLCLTVPLPPVLGAMALLGDRPTEPTEVALGAAGFPEKKEERNEDKQTLCFFLNIVSFHSNHTYHCLSVIAFITNNPRNYGKDLLSTRTVIQIHELLVRNAPNISMALALIFRHSL